MTIKSRILAAAVAVTGVLATIPTLAVTIAPPGVTVNTAEQKATVVNATVTSVDVQRGVLVASGRTYRFDPAAVSFSDDRREPSPAGLASLRSGSKVTLRTVPQNGQNRLLQIVARD